MPAQFQIKQMWTEQVLFECEAECLREAMEKAAKAETALRGANLRDANLTGANLRDANLTGAYLTGANLRDANLRGANLTDAYLRGANLTGANLTGANLTGAYLEGAKVNWNSHAMIAEILRRWAGDDIERRMVAGLVAVSTDWCWNRFTTLAIAHRDDALAHLATWIQDGDNAPDVLQHLRKAA